MSCVSSSLGPLPQVAGKRPEFPNVSAAEQQLLESICLSALTYFFSQREQIAPNAQSASPDVLKPRARPVPTSVQCSGIAGKGKNRKRCLKSVKLTADELGTSDKPIKFCTHHLNQAPKTTSTSRNPGPAIQQIKRPTSVKCSGVSGPVGKKRSCSNVVKIAPDDIGPVEKLVKYCPHHKPLGSASCGSTQMKDVFKELLGDVLPVTRDLMCRTIKSGLSKSDEPGYLYIFEIQDPHDPLNFTVKVGRSIDPNDRVLHWVKKCAPKCQRGKPDSKSELEEYRKASVKDISVKKPLAQVPSTVFAGTSFSSRLRPGETGTWCRLLERLVHLHLADVAIRGIRKEEELKNEKTVPLTYLRESRDRCQYCEVEHKEIFTFPRNGPEEDVWTTLVRPIVEKWSNFIKEFYDPAVCEAE